MRRIVLDTNCLLACLPSQSPYHKVWVEFLNGQIELCVSTEILLEYEEIIAKHSSSYMAETILKILSSRNNVIRIEPSWRFNLIKSDYDDNKFVDCAICGNAEYIVSNDAHFNILSQYNFPYVHVVKIQHFLTLLNS